MDGGHKTEVAASTEKNSLINRANSLEKIEESEPRATGRSITTLVNRHKILSDHRIKKPDSKPAPVEQLLKFITPHKESPMAHNWWISNLFFSWANPLFERDSNTLLQHSDLYAIPAAGTSKEVKLKFQRKKEKHERPNRTKLSYLHTAFNMVRKSYYRACTMFVFASILQFVATLISQQYLQYISNKSSSDNSYLVQLAYMFALGVNLLLRSILLNQSLFHIAGIGKELSILIRPQIFEKLLRLNIVHLDLYSDTKLVNLLTVDVDNLIRGLNIVPNFIAAFSILVAQFYFLYSLGYITIFLILLLFIVVWLFKRLHSRTLKGSNFLLIKFDSISQIIKDHVKYIVDIRLGGYSSLLEEKILSLKMEESLIFRKFLKYSQRANMLTFIFPTLFGLTYFALSILFSKSSEINVTEAFVILTVLSIIRTPISFINKAFDAYPEYKASKQRIEEFLEEIPVKLATDFTDESIPKGCIEKAYFGPSIEKINEQEFKEEARKIFTRSGVLDGIAADDDFAMLEDISLNIEPSKNLAILGPEHSGKSFLIFALLGELKLIKGSCKINGTLSYCPVEPCLVNDSIAQNILMGKPFDSIRYANVLEACKLNEVLQEMKNGDNLLLKDNGRNIPAKFCRRIALARMLYHEADIYLIDGFFDTFDEDFLAHLYTVVLKDFLKEKTVILITNQIEFLRYSQYVAVMKDGRIEKLGTMEELNKVSKETVDEVLGINAYMELPTRNSKAATVIHHNMHTQFQVPRQQSPFVRREIGFKAKESVENYFFLPIQNTRRWRVIFQKFFFNRGWIFPVSYVTLLTLSQLSTYAFFWFTAAWKQNMFSLSAYGYIIVYSAIAALALLLIYSTNTIFTKYFRRVSFRLFVNIVLSLNYHPLDWFTQHQASSILNVFVTDYNEVDHLMGPSISTFIQSSIRITVGLLVILYQTWLTSVLILAVYVAILMKLYKFLKTDRCLKHIVNFNRSLLVSTILDAHRGLLVFRNSSHSSYLNYVFNSVHDIFQHSKSTDGNVAVRWLSARVFAILMLVPLIIMLEHILKPVVGIDNNYTWIGVIFSVAFDVCFTEIAFVSSFSKTETFYSNIERIVDLCIEDNKKQEIATRMSKKHSMVGGDEATIVDFSNVSYRSSGFANMTLKNVSFKIKNHENIALVGEAGSGKHTILSLMAKTTNPNNICNGSVEIFGKPFTPEFGGEIPKECFYFSSRFHMFGSTLLENMDPRLSQRDDKGNYVVRGKVREQAISAIIDVLEYLGFFELKQSIHRKPSIKRRFTSIQQVATAKVNMESVQEEELKYRGDRKISFVDGLSLIQEKSYDSQILQEIKNSIYSLGIEDGIMRLLEEADANQVGTDGDANKHIELDFSMIHNRYTRQMKSKRQSAGMNVSLNRRKPARMNSIKSLDFNLDAPKKRGKHWSKLRKHYEPHDKPVKRTELVKKLGEIKNILLQKADRVSINEKKNKKKIRESELFDNSLTPAFIMTGNSTNQNIVHMREKYMKDEISKLRDVIRRDTKVLTQGPKSAEMSKKSSEVEEEPELNPAQSIKRKNLNESSADPVISISKRWNGEAVRNPSSKPATRRGSKQLEALDKNWQIVLEKIHKDEVLSDDYEENATTKDIPRSRIYLNHNRINREIDLRNLELLQLDLRLERSAMKVRR